MTVKKIHNKLELLINYLTIKEDQENYLRKKTNEFYSELKVISHYQIPFWSNPYLSSNSSQYTLERFWYGGSFDRGIFIKNRFDIDQYFVFKEYSTPYPTILFPWSIYPKEHQNLTGKFLFELIYSKLIAYQNYYGMKIKVLKNPPYGHAIPVRMDDYGVSVLFDCIPAIEEPNGYLIIPNGMGGTKKINPNLEQQSLSKLNKKQNGKITKLILLTKYWNFNWGKPMKGYLVERLVESIFDKIMIHTWDRAVKTFFNRAIYILDKKKKLPDRVYSQYSILDEYLDGEIKIYLELLREAANYAQNGNWDELFNEI